MRFNVYNYGPVIKTGLIHVKSNSNVIGEFTAIFRTRFYDHKDHVVVVGLDNHILHIGKRVPDEAIERLTQTYKTVRKPFLQFEINLPEGMSLKRVSGNTFKFNHVEFDDTPFTAKDTYDPNLPIEKHDEDIVVVNRGEVFMDSMLKQIDKETRTKPVDPSTVDTYNPETDIEVQDLKGDIAKFLKPEVEVEAEKEIKAIKSAPDTKAVIKETIKKRRSRRK